MNMDERLLVAILTVKDFSKGTLWWIKDALWKAIKPEFIVKRKHHPAIAIGNKDHIDSIQDTMPVLFGTSQKISGLCIKGLSDERQDDYSTFFQIRIYRAPIKEMIGKVPNIEENHYKQKLSPQEMINLNNYLRSKGLNI